MNALDTATEMLSRVAVALGEPLLNDVVFVGGCTTGLWVTDDFSRQGIRLTTGIFVVFPAQISRVIAVQI